MKMNLIKKFRDTLFRTVTRYDLAEWEELESPSALPIYGVYHIYCDKDWQRMVDSQLSGLRRSGLLDATAKLYISIIAGSEREAETVRRMVGDARKVEIISDCRDAHKFEYPALEFIRQKSTEEDCLIYYFHTKGITYQGLDTEDRKFNHFKRNIESWRAMMEYFLFDKWKVAVNVLSGEKKAAADFPGYRCLPDESYDVYGCYRFPPPPLSYYLYAGNFWWARGRYLRSLPEFDESRMAGDRFFAEEWLFRGKPRSFSAFDTLADLYCVNMERSLYETDMKATFWQKARFALRYNFVKLCRHGFGYDYKASCQRRYQRLK